MKLFLDTSSLVKLYHQEAGTDELAALIESKAYVIWLSEIACLEFRSAVLKKVRTGELERLPALTVIKCFESDSGLFNWVAIDNLITTNLQPVLFVIPAKAGNQAS